ncbi:MULTISPECIES: hypothetical protein [Bacillus]
MEIFDVFRKKVNQINLEEFQKNERVTSQIYAEICKKKITDSF